MKKRRPQPLAPPPQSSALRSRKRARKATTLFHKYTQERDAAVARARAGGCRVDDDVDVAEELDGGNLSPRQMELLEEVHKWNEKIVEMGGREEYQRASQMNTSLFSTSKWVLGILGKWGWLDGLPILDDDDSSGQAIGLEKDTRKDDAGDHHSRKRGKRRKMPRRNVNLLEVGAINTQLLDAAERTRVRQSHPKSDNERQADTQATNDRVYHLDVHAIDIRSTDPRIRQMDFFDLEDSNKSTAASHGANRPYDAIVNSMVINCLTTPAQRGRMLHLCYRHLRPGGVCFLTLPKLCLIQSKFMSRTYFEEILTKGVGFEILRDVGRDSPKVAFFVLRRPRDGGDGIREWNDKFSRTTVLHRGKKFRNTYAVTLKEEELDG